MREEIVVLSEGDRAVQRPCAKCARLLAAGDSAVTCPRCKSVHHLACWQERAGCAKRGCPQVATMAAPRPPQEAAPPHRSGAARVRGVPGWLLAAGAIAALTIIGIFYRAAKPAAAPPAFTVMLPATEQRLTLDPIIQNYKEQHADAPVDVVWIPPGPLYEEKLLIMFAARQAPDVVAVPLDRIHFYAQQGALVSLDALVQEGKGLKVSYPGGRLAQGRVDGAYYGIPDPGIALWFAVTSQSKAPELAMDFIRYLVERIPVVDQLEDEKALPFWPALPPARVPPPPSEGARPPR